MRATPMCSSTSLRSARPLAKRCLGLGEGDAVALSGPLTPKAWLDKEGAARPALDLVASHVLTAYHVTRKRKALERRPCESHEPQLPPDAQPFTRHDDFDEGGPMDF